MDIGACIKTLREATKTGRGMLGLLFVLFAGLLSIWRLAGDVEFLISNWALISGFLKIWGPPVGFVVGALLIGKAIYDTANLNVPQPDSGGVASAAAPSEKFFLDGSEPLPRREPPRHYSKADKDNIADAFHELRTIIHGDVTVLHDEAERLARTWPQRPRRVSGALDFSDTLQRLDRVRSFAASLGDEIFNVWLKKNKSYETLLRPIIDFRRPNCFSNLMHFCDSRKLAIESAHSAYAKAPNQAHQMAVMMGAMLEPMDTLRAHLNGWMADTERRIVEQERIVLSQDN